MSYVNGTPANPCQSVSYRIDNLLGLSSSITKITSFAKMCKVLARIFHKCYAAARRGGRLAGKVAAEAGITASARNPPLPP